MSGLPTPQPRTGLLGLEQDSIEYEKCSERPTEVTIAENMDVSHSMILDDRKHPPKI
jgi:hypothetical protein